MKIKEMLAACAATALLAGSAGAATISFTTGTGNSPQLAPLTFSGGGTSVKVSATQTNNSGGTTGGTALIASYAGPLGGLGVCSSKASSNDTGGCEDDDYKIGKKEYDGDSHLVDGKDANEMVLFDFGSTIVKLTSVTFNYNEAYDTFSFVFGDSVFTSVNIPGTDFMSTYIFDGNWTGSKFGIGAIADGSDFKIKSIDFQVVPLPATAFLLLGAFAGLTVLRQRRKA